MRKRFSLLNLLLTLFCFYQTSELFALDYIDRADGLPSLQVLSIEQDNQGYIWAATAGGLARYNGKSVYVFGKKDGLENVVVFSIYQDQYNHIWLGSNEGLIRYHEGKFKKLPSTRDLGVVNKVIVDSNNQLWAAAVNGLFFGCTKCSLEPVKIPEHIQANFTHIVEQTDISSSSEKKLWLLNDAKKLWLYQYDTSNPNGQFIKTDILKYEGEIFSIIAGKDGHIFASTINGVLEIDANGKVVSKIIEDSVMGSLDSLNYENDRLTLKFTDRISTYQEINNVWALTSSRPDDNDTIDIMYDRHGNFYMATEDKGIAKVPITHYMIDKINSQCESPVLSIAAYDLKQSQFLLGGSDCSVIYDQKNNVTKQIQELNNVQVWDSVKDKYGRVFLATYNGLMIWENNRITPIDLNNRFISSPNSSLLLENERLYLSSIVGMIELEIQSPENDNPVKILKEHELGYIYSINKDQWNRIWLGSIGKGLMLQRKNGEFESIDFPNKEASTNTTDIAFNPDGKLAAVVSDRILIVEFNAAGEIIEKSISDRIFKSNLNIWALIYDNFSVVLGTSNGLKIYDPEIKKITTHITQRMGLVNGESTTSRSLIVSDDRKILTGTNGGLYQLALDMPPLLVDLVPELFLEDVHWQNTPEKWSFNSETNEAPYAKSVLEINLFSPWYLDEDSLFLRYKLEGFDETWAHEGKLKDTQIRYTALPPGDYKLIGQLNDPLNGWTEQHELYQFKVKVPWWQNSWVQFLGLVLFGLSILFFGIFRNRSIKKQALLMEQEVLNRTKELEKLTSELSYQASHDNLTGLMNHRAFWTKADELMHMANREHLFFGLLMLDLDHFKGINDNYGHLVGDQGLIHAANLISHCCRETDYISRYGGEEFGILALCNSPHELYALAERIGNKLRSHPLELEFEQTITLTGSIGVSHWLGATDSAKSLFQRADQALYEAKKERDKFVVWTTKLNKV